MQVNDVEALQAAADALPMFPSSVPATRSSKPLMNSQTCSPLDAV